MANFDFEEYRKPWETGPHWELKREFLEKYQNDFPLDRLLCLAQAYSNIELLHCSYPEPVMQEVYQLSCQLKECKRFREAEADLERRRKEKLEMQPRKAGKRSSSYEISTKSFKFIKFCSSEEASNASKSNNENEINSKEFVQHDSKILTNDSRIPVESEDFIQNSSINADANDAVLPRTNNNGIFSLSDSPDFGSMLKIAAAIPKNSRSPLESMESAIEASSLETAVKYVFVHEKSSVVCCQFYIGNTLISTGRDVAEKSAKEISVLYGMEILKNLLHLPKKTLEDVKRELENWKKVTQSELLWSEISSDLKSEQLMSQLSEMKKDPTYADLHLILQIIQKLFDEKSTKKKNIFASQMIHEAVAKINCGSQAFFFHFREDPDTLLHFRSFYCDFVIKNILICQSKASSKKKAKVEASQQGLNLLENFIKNCDLQKQQNEQDQGQSLGMNFESSKSITTVITNNKDINNLVPKMSQRDKEYSSNKEEDECNKLLYNESKTKNSLKSVADNLSEMHLKTFAPNSKCNNEKNSNSESKHKLFRINHRLLTNSRNQQLIIFDSSEDCSTTVSPILFASAHKCKKELKSEIEKIPVDTLGNSAEMFRCSITLDGVEIGKAQSFTEKETKSIACAHALQFLQNCVYTIKVKNEIEESFIISRSQVLNTENPSNILSESNIGCKMMKMMGWTGGGIGKTSGITEPIVANDHSFGQGLGFSNRKTQKRSFKQKIEALLKDYSQSSTISDLIFSNEFTKEERKEIHNIASRYHLSSNSRGKGEKRQIFIGRKYAPMELLERLVEAGGSTPKYELEDRSASDKTSVSRIRIWQPNSCLLFR